VGFGSGELAAFAAAVLAAFSAALLRLLLLEC